MCLFRKKRQEQVMNAKINAIIDGSGYTLALYKKDYKHFGNCIIKLVCPGKANIKIITDRHEIIFDNKVYRMDWIGNIREIDRDILILEFLKLILSTDTAFSSAILSNSAEYHGTSITIKLLNVLSLSFFIRLSVLKL